MGAGYDIVGDVHGQARALLRLCHKLGYDEWGHHREGRQLIFLGDLPNKGPRNHRVIRQVTAWVEQGRAHAIMGNHEFESLAWTLRDRAGDPLIPRTPANREKLQAFHKVRRKNPFAYRRHLDFFAQRPLWLDMGEFRCVHACWEADSIAYLESKLGPEARLRKRHIRKAFKDGHAMQGAVQTVLYGPQMSVPKKARRKMARPKAELRMRWWAPEEADMAELALARKGRDKALKGREPKWRVSYTDSVPVFFGHYHLREKPFLTAPYAACLDFGAGSGRYLTAYRWSGESELSASRLVSVPV